jgi:hypothetical protein
MKEHLTNLMECLALTVIVVKYKKDKLSSPCALTKYHAMKTYARVEVQFNAFLTLALDDYECSTSCPSCFTPGERTLGIHSIEG